MIDLHCHILCDFDDGASDFRESVKMAKIAAYDGIRKIVATPHIKNDIHPPEDIKKAVSRINMELIRLRIPVRIIQGAEVSHKIDTSLIKHYTILNTNYILIEFDHTHLPANITTVIFNYLANGLRPIVAHPERNLSVIKNPKIVSELCDSGAIIQITADSLTGTFGYTVSDCAAYLLKQGYVSLLCSDAHSAAYRAPVLSNAVSVAAKIIGEKKAHDLVKLNPETILKGDLL